MVGVDEGGRKERFIALARAASFYHHRALSIEESGPQLSVLCSIKFGELPSMRRTHFRAHLYSR